MGALRHIVRYLPRTSRQILASGMIMSRINYLIQVWGGTEKKYIKKIQTVLNSTARFVTGKPRRMSMRNLMTSCNWMYMSELADYHTTIMMWNFVNRGKPHHFKSNINVETDCKLTMDPARLQTTATAYRLRATKTSNELNDDLRLNKSLQHSNQD